jgi:hypothetical protein
VRHHDDRRALVVQLMQQLQDLLAGPGIQVARGLVGQDDGRVVDQCPGDGHPLLLSARQLVGPVMHPLAQSHRFEGSDRAFVALSVGQRIAAVVQQRQQHVFGRGQPGQQVVRLEDEADLAVPHAGQLVLAQPADVLPIQHVRAAGRAVQAAQDVHQRGLARAGGSHDGEEFTLFDGQVDPSQRVHGDLAGAVDFGQVRDLD